MDLACCAKCKTWHPNVSGDRIRSDKNALKYISKEDPEPLEWPSPFIKEETAAREGHRKILTKRIIENPGKTLEEYVDEG